MSNRTPTGHDEARNRRGHEFHSEIDDGSSWSLLTEEQRECYRQSADRLLDLWRAPSLDRGAEEMRALPTSDFRQGRKVPRNVYHGDEPLFMAATDDLASELVQVLNAGAAAIRALPVPAGLNEGDADAPR